MGRKRKGTKRSEEGRVLVLTDSYGLDGWQTCDITLAGLVETDWCLIAEMDLLTIFPMYGGLRMCAFGLSNLSMLQLYLGIQEEKAWALPFFKTSGHI
jgi:hypothetical protein